MNLDWKITNEQAVQLAMCTAYLSADTNKIDKDTTTTVYDLYDAAPKDEPAKGRFRFYGDKNNNYDVGANNWEVRHYYDHDGPKESGFYGSLVIAKDEDGQEHAILLFRGSNDNLDKVNSWRSLMDMKSEWTAANGGLHHQNGLLGVSETTQQRQARDFAISMMEKYPDLDFSMLGHSLGGQLGFYVAIYIAENRPDLKYRINKAYNLDGPGFSDEFNRKHKAAINWLNENEKMEHWQWSAVGDLLHSPVPENNHNHKIVEINKKGNRHTSPPAINENGDLILGSKDFVSFMVGNGSRFLEDYGDLLVFYSLTFMGPIGALIGFAGITYWVWEKIGGWEGIKEKAKDGWNNLKKTVSKAYNGVKNYIKSIGQKKLDGDYEINLQAISDIAEQYAALSDNYKSIADESESLLLSCWEETFKTADSFWLRTTAYSCFESTRECSNALKKTSDNLNEVIRLYKKGDNDAANEYYNRKLATNS